MSRLTLPQRLVITALLLCVGLFALVLYRAWQVQTQPIPASLETTYGEASIAFRVDNRYVLFRNDCVRASWNVEGIKGVSINDDATIGSDSREVCGETPYLTVIFADDSQQDFFLPREVVVETPLFYALIAATAGLLLAGGWVFGVWQWGYRVFLRVSHFTGRIWAWLTRWLPAPPPEAPGERWLHLWLLCGLILFGAALRLIYIRLPITGDEAWTFVDFAAPPLWLGLPNYWSTNNHLFNSLLIHVTYRLFGDDVLWLRLPAFFAGVFLIGITYQAGRRLYNRSAGLLAAALMTVSSIYIEYSTQARGYTIMISIFLALLILAQRIIHADRRADWARFAMLTALGFFTIPIMIYPFVIVAGWLGITLLATEDQVRRYRLLRHYVLAMIAAGALTIFLYTPVALFSLAGIETRTDYEHLEMVSVRRVFEDLRLWVDIMWDIEWMRDMPGLIDRLLQPLLIVAVIAHARISKDRFSLPLVALLTGLAVLFTYRIVLIPRVWLFALPLLFIGASAGAVYISDVVLSRLRLPRLLPISAAALALALWLGSLVAQSDTINSPDQSYYAPAVAAYLDRTLQPGDQIISEEYFYNLLRYHAAVSDYDLGDMRSRYNPNTAPERLLVPAYTEEGTGLERALEITNIDTGHYGNAKLLRRIDEMDIYALYRLDDE